MGSPYLNSGETIVLTTNRVVAEGVSYDVMLTSERVFLIDSRMARLEPRIVPLPDILAVQGGKTPAQEPVITIIFREKLEGESPPPLNLLFSQNPGENRKPERDDWVRGLIRLSIHLQEKAKEPEKPVVQPVQKEPGLHPMARHGVALEMVRPLSNVADDSRWPAPLTVFPEVVPGSGEIPLPSPAIPETRESVILGERPEVPTAHPAPVRGTPLPSHSPPARVVIPQIIEELLPRNTRPASPPEDKPPLPVVLIDKEALLRTIPVSVRSMTVTEEAAFVPSPAEETVSAPVLPEPEIPEERELPEILRALYTGPVEPLTEEPASPEPEPVSAVPEQEPEPVSAVPEQEPEPVSAVPEQEPEPVSAVPEQEPEPVSAVPEQEPEADGEPAEAASLPGQPVHRWSELFPQKTEPAGQNTEPVPEIKGIDEESADAAEEEKPHELHAVPEHDESGGKGPAAHPVFGDEREKDLIPAEPSPVRRPIPPAREIRPARTLLAYAAVVLIIVALVAAGAMLVLLQGPGPGDAEVTPALVTVQVTPLPSGTIPPSTAAPGMTVTVSPGPIAVPAPASIPQEGVWVRLTSTADYSGSLGNTGMMRQVSGSGDSLHPIFWPDHPVLVSVRKNDNSGAILTATVYRNGTAISTRSVRSPMGTVEILIDPRTALAPGLSAEDTGLSGAQGSSVPATT